MVPIVKGPHARMPEPTPLSTLPTPGAAGPELEHHLRADARRNRAAILQAAEAVFGAQGPDAPVDEIAHRAGVGVGTLYRHFPTKEALLHAVVVAHIEPLLAAARSAGASDQPGTAFFALLRHLAREFAAFSAVAEAIAASGIDLHQAKSEASGELMTALDTVLTRAQGSGSVREDVTIEDVATMMGALCMSGTVTRHPATFARCVDLVCDGLRPVRGAAPEAGR